jgi:hypothetical protein
MKVLFMSCTTKSFAIGCLYYYYSCFYYYYYYYYYVPVALAMSNVRVALCLYCWMVVKMSSIIKRHQFRRLMIYDD